MTDLVFMGVGPVEGFRGRIYVGHDENEKGFV
jgi:hypothetical protein